MQELLNVSEVKMTSVELAELTGKQHAHIMRDIRNEIELLGEEGQSIFGETSYTDQWNRQQPCYTFGRDGAMQLALKYDAITRRKVIVKLEELERPRLDTSGLSPHLQMFNNLFIAMANQEMQLKQASEAAGKALTMVEDIKDTIIKEYDDWRDELNHLLGKIQRSSNIPHQELRSKTYEELERRARCDLSTRVRNLRKRLTEEGATVTRVKQANKLEVIESDPKLKEIYTQVVKEYAVKYSA